MKIIDGRSVHWLTVGPPLLLMLVLVLLLVLLLLCTAADPVGRLLGTSVSQSTSPPLNSNPWGGSVRTPAVIADIDDVSTAIAVPEGFCAAIRIPILDMFAGMFT